MRLIKIVLALAVVSLALPGAAEEIVYFKNGQSLPIRNHVTSEGMVRVDLGSNNMMQFPEFTIDRIEVAGKSVLLERSYGVAANTQVPSTQGTFPVKGIRRPSIKPEIPMKGHAKATPVTVDPVTGLAGYQPQGHRRAPNRKKVTIHGNMRVLSQNPTRLGQGDGENSFAGTTTVGNRHIIGNVTPRRSRNPNYPESVSVTMKGSRTPSRDAPAPPPDSSDER